MNPPFTRSVGGNLLFGSLPPTERRKLQNELSRPAEVEAGFRDGRTWGSIRGGSVTQTAAGRGTAGTRATGDRMHRAFVGADKGLIESEFVSIQSSPRTIRCVGTSPTAQTCPRRC